MSCSRLSDSEDVSILRYSSQACRRREVSRRGERCDGGHGAGKGRESAAAKERGRGARLAGLAVHDVAAREPREVEVVGRVGGVLEVRGRGRSRCLDASHTRHRRTHLDEEERLLGVLVVTHSGLRRGG